MAVVCGFFHFGSDFAMATPWSVVRGAAKFDVKPNTHSSRCCASSERCETDMQPCREEQDEHGGEDQSFDAPPNTDDAKAMIMREAFENPTEKAVQQSSIMSNGSLIVKQTKRPAIAVLHSK